MAQFLVFRLPTNSDYKQTDRRTNRSGSAGREAGAGQGGVRRSERQPPACAAAPLASPMRHSARPGRVTAAYVTLAETLVQLFRPGRVTGGSRDAFGALGTVVLP